MAIFASGVQNPDFSGVDYEGEYAKYKRDTAAKTADQSLYDANKGYGVTGDVMSRTGVSAGTANAYLNNAEGTDFLKRLSGDLAARKSPTAGVTSFGPGGYAA